MIVENLIKTLNAKETHISVNLSESQIREVIGSNAASQIDVTVYLDEADWEMIVYRIATSGYFVVKGRWYSRWLLRLLGGVGL